MKSVLKIALPLAAAAGIYSCSPVRHLHPGEYMLTKADIEVIQSEKDSTGRRIDPELLISPAQLKQYSYLKPDRGFSGLNFLSGRKRNPVLLDTALADNSAEGMRIYMGSRGYIHSQASFTIDTSGRKAAVTYAAVPGDLYLIGDINYRFEDRLLEEMILADTALSMIRSGDPFDTEMLRSERNRITARLKEIGYYDFSVGNIYYSAKTTAAGNKVDLTIVIRQNSAGAVGGMTGGATGATEKEATENNYVYRIRNVYVHADYDPSLAASDQASRSRLDTISFEGLNIIYDTSLEIKPEVLRRAVYINPDDVYNDLMRRRTYNNIMELEYYRNATITYDKVSDILPEDFITYPGAASDPADSMKFYIRERYLDCNIFCVPSKKQSYTVELEGGTTSDYYAITGKVGYQNRNLFRGAEILNVGLRGSYEFMRAAGQRSSFEYGIAASVSFPHFISPLSKNPLSIHSRKTTVEISYDVQRRPFYHRTISGIVWGYSWRKGNNHSFIFRPVDINIVKLRYIDADFLAGISNPYLRESYNSQFVAGMSASYIFNNRFRNANVNSSAFRVNFESNGNVLSGLNAVFNGKTDTYHKIFGIRYAQYMRLDANYAKCYALGDRSSLALRLYGGWAYAYGNGNSIPIERLFYGGGSNSMRGWMPRTLGPGNEAQNTDEKYPSRFGNMKLEANAEGRFPIMGIVNGALFLDMGNVWLTNQKTHSPEGNFRFDRFYKQLGLNTGVGVRLDFNMFVFRIDWGIQLHNPNKPLGERWITGLDINNSALHFGVGYPF